RRTVEEVKRLKRWLEPYHALRKRVTDGGELTELLEAEAHVDLALQRQLEQEADAIGAQLEALELQNMLQGPDDARDALLTIHPGAGGTESQDWAEMLMRMYVRWAERHGFKVDVLDLLQGEEAGIKSAEIVGACQQERSQGKNKATAMKMLKSRLYERALEAQAAKKAEVDKQKGDIAFGSQIRSYVFQPYTMVNDHRTELKVGDVQKVMDGDLDPFIEAYLKRFGSKAA